MRPSMPTVPTEAAAVHPSGGVRPQSWPVLLILVSAWALGCLCLLWILVGSGQVGPVGLWLKYNYLTAPGLIAGGSYMLWRYGGAGGPAMLAIFLLTVALVILFGSWHAGESNFFFIGGLLPFSDAHGYYNDALRLLSGWRFSEFSSRRPLFPALLAVLLALTSLSLPLTLIVLTAISILAVGFAVREAQRHLGTAAGILMLLCLFMFYRRFIGATLTEHLGLAWGCLAFCFLWRGAALHRPRPVMVGLFLLALALSARAGAFLVIPAVALWAGVRFRGPNRRGLKVAGGGLAAVLLGFAANAMLLQAVGISNAAYSNFSYTLYGLVFGGDWALVLRQHPELAALSESERTGRIYALAWDGARANPLALASGALRAWRAFLSGGSSAWYSFPQYVSPEWAHVPQTTRPDDWQVLIRIRDLWAWVNGAGRYLWGIALQGGALAGIFVLWRNRRAALTTLTAAAWIGIFLSVPFAPPWDAENMRAYAATMPFLVAPPVLGAGLMQRRPMGRWGNDPRPRSGTSADVTTLCLLLIVAQFLGPVAILGSGWRPTAGTEPTCAVRCESGRQRYLAVLNPSAAVHLFDPIERGSTVLPGNWVNLQDFRARTVLRAYPDLWHMWRGLSSLASNTTLALAFDRRQGGAIYLQGPTTDFPTSGRVALLCGEVVRHPWITWVKVDGWGRC
jgi:hypothetical protein